MHYNCALANSPYLNITRYLRFWDCQSLIFEDLPGEDMTIELSVMYKLKRGDQKEDEGSKMDEMTELVKRTIEELHYPFLQEKEAQLIDNFSDITMRNFSEMSDDTFSQYCTKMFADDEETDDKVVFARPITAESLSKLSIQQFLAVLRSHLLKDKPERKRILVYFEEQRISGKAMAAMKKKTFLNGLMNHGDNKEHLTKRGPLIELFTEIKEFNPRTIARKQRKNMAPRQLFNWFDSMKREIKRRLRMEDDDDPSDTENKSKKRQHWASKLWQAHHQKAFNREHEDIEALITSLSEHVVLQEYLDDPSRLRIRTVLSFYDTNTFNIIEIPYFDDLIRAVLPNVPVDDPKLTAVRQFYEQLRETILDQRDQRADEMKKLARTRTMAESGGSTVSSLDTETSATGWSGNMYRRFRQGQFMRYSVLGPTYDSLADEVIMNGMLLLSLAVSATLMSPQIPT